MPENGYYTDTVKLQDICHLITDGKHGDCQNEENSGYYFLSAKDIRNRKLNYENARQITRKDFLQTHKRTRLEPLDILIISTGATIGRMAMAPDNEFTGRTTFQKSVAILKPNKEVVSPQWLFYKLHAVKERLINTAGGTAQNNLLLRDLRTFEIDIYSLKVQRKIAAVLSAYDDLIENNSRRIAILEAMAHLLYREWFVEFRYPGHESVPLVESELGPVPEGWEVKPISEAVEINPKINVDRETEKPFVEMANLTTNSMIVECTQTRTGRSGSKFQNNDTLFPRITPSVENGKRGFVQFLLDGQVALGSTEFIVLRSKTLCPEYVYLLSIQSDFRDHAAKSMVGASGRQRVQYECFDSYFIAQPPPDLLSKFSGIVSPMFESVHTLSQKDDTLRQTRDLLLPRLISGELDVADLDIVGS